MANNFFQLEDEKEVFRGTPTGNKIIRGKGFATEEAFIAAGGVRGTDNYWENVKSITPEQLTTVSPIDITTGAPKEEAVDSGAVIVAGAEEQKTQSEILQEKEVAELATKEKAGEEGIADILTRLEEEPAERLAKEEEVGLPGFQKERTAVRGQVAIETAEYRQMESQLEAALTAAGEPGMLQTHFLGLQGQIRREFRSQMNLKASSIAILRAQESALSGNIMEAQNQVNNAINVRYQADRLRLDTEKFMLQAISGDLTDAEQRLADIQNDRIAREEAELEEQKQRDKDIENIAITAVANGATPDIVEQIRQAPDAITASQIAQPFITETEAGAYKVGTIRTFTEGTQTVTRQLTEDGWVEVARGPRFKPTAPVEAPLSEEEFKEDFRRRYSEENKATPFEPTVERAWQEYSQAAPEVIKFTGQEQRKLEQQFGSDWQTATSRQEQLDFLYEREEPIESIEDILWD